MSRVYEKSHFCAEGHLAHARARGYGRRHDRAPARRARSIRPRIPPTAVDERRLRRAGVREPRRAAAGGGAGRPRPRRPVRARPLPRRRLPRHRPRPGRHVRARACARALRRLPHAPVRI
ncbi:MAG: hypothetical protein E6F98_02445 [Actinobacteria bacterium]|nr:MAG: hypothetical protein E6F98_02445 [Actinomycetota bacterium]